MSDPFFIQLKEPKRLQVNILSASKNILQVTRSQLHLEALAKEKFELKESIASQLRSIGDTVARLQEELPHHELLKHIPKQHQAPKTVHKHEAPPVSTSSLSEIEKLNAAIESIEKKLSDLK